MARYLRRSGHPLASEIFELTARIAAEGNLHLADATSADVVLTAIADLFEQAQSPIRVHGRRSEEMFRYVVAALGRARAIKREDTGDVLADEADQITTPEFRIVLRDGGELLVEVKTSIIQRRTNPFASKRITSGSSRLTGRFLGVPCTWRFTGHAGVNGRCMRSPASWQC